MEIGGTAQPRTVVLQFVSYCVFESMFLFINLESWREVISLVSPSLSSISVYFFNSCCTYSFLLPVPLLRFDHETFNSLQLVGEIQQVENNQLIDSAFRGGSILTETFEALLDKGSRGSTAQLFTSKGMLANSTSEYVDYVYEFNPKRWTYAWKGGRHFANTHAFIVHVVVPDKLNASQLNSITQFKSATFAVVSCRRARSTLTGAPAKPVLVRVSNFSSFGRVVRHE